MNNMGQLGLWNAGKLDRVLGDLSERRGPSVRVAHVHAADTAAVDNGAVEL